MPAFHLRFLLILASAITLWGCETNIEDLQTYQGPPIRGAEFREVSIQTTLTALNEYGVTLTPDALEYLKREIASRYESMPDWLAEVNIASQQLAFHLRSNYNPAHQITLAQLKETLSSSLCPLWPYC